MKMGNTITEKILMEKSGKEKASPGDFIFARPDTVMSHDNTYAIIEQFLKTGKELQNKNNIVVIFDHNVPAVKSKQQEIHEIARRFARENGLHFYDAGVGVSHQVMMELGYVLPGELIIGSDSHSTIYGSLGALGIPVNRTDMAAIWAFGETWFKVPHTIKIEINGELKKGIFSKDVMLKILKQISASGAVYRAIEFSGSTIEEMSIESRMTLTNMAVELGAKAGVMPFDRKTEMYLEGRAIRTYIPVFSDSDAGYERIIRIDAENLEPQIACPHTVDNVKPISEVEGTKITYGYLGSCTNGRLEDLMIAAEILENNKINENVRLVVYPASSKIFEDAEKSGIIKILMDAGAEIQTASCGPCFGASGEIPKEGEICISSSNRNFKGRMGPESAQVYLGSPAVVAASCIEGRIADPRRYL